MMEGNQMAAMMGGGCFGAMGGMGAMGGCAEVRFDIPSSTMTAIQALNGSFVMGQQITVQADMTSKDGTKIIVSGLAPGVSWQELKDHFAQAGTVAFAGMKSGGMMEG